MSTFEKDKRKPEGESLANLPVACTLTPEEFRTRKSSHLVEAGKSLQERVETPDGYAFRFTLTSEPGDGPVWLELNGPPESKSFLATFWE